MTQIVDASLAELVLEERADSGRWSAILQLVQALRAGGVSTFNVGEIHKIQRFEAIHSLALSHQELPIMVQTQMSRRQITLAAEALKPARRRRLSLTVQTSPESVRRFGSGSYAELLIWVDSCVGYAHRLGLETDLVIPDTAETDPVFLGRLAQQARTTGAAGMILVENGRMTPDAFTATVRRVARAIPGGRVGIRLLRQANTGIETALAGLEQGATELEFSLGNWVESRPLPYVDALAAAGLLALDSALVSRLLMQAASFPALKVAVGQA